MANEIVSGLAEYRPAYRRLRVFAFDPSLGLQLETASVNELTLDVIWETDRETGGTMVGLGPVGEYLEVFDYDPASGCYYPPIDLNDRYLLAQDGLPPSEGNPQFHQQMVYAVAMATIDHFERALGRVALWAPRLVRDGNGRVQRSDFVRRLRIYPHGLREANAYYSPGNNALLFGHFPSRGGDGTQLPGGMVFTCLSHDVIAHETTHALLDGLHPRFNEATNHDVHALHEGFADIVALFQRFSHPEVLEHQIARTRGDLEQQNLLGQLAQEFGRALGKRGALRDAIGGVNPVTGQWEHRSPDPAALNDAIEPHARGAILVAAVFDAFMTIYRARSADLFRIASNGTGVLPEGDIHPDLVKRLAREAARSADGILRMCIRALDYVPPVDITFGDYLRAVITADLDLHPEDRYNYRIAFVEAFRQWGIFPDGIRSLSVSSLRHPRMDLIAGGTSSRAADKQFYRDAKQVKWMQACTSELFTGLSGSTAQRKARRQGDVGILDYGADEVSEQDILSIDWDLSADRKAVWDEKNDNARLFHRWLTKGPISRVVGEFGLTLSTSAPPSVYRTWDRQTPSIEIHSIRTAQRRGVRGEMTTDLVVEMCQRRRGYFDPQTQREVDSGKRKIKRGESGDFRFRRGCTLIIDTATHRIRYAISNSGDVSDNSELERVRRFLTGEGSDPQNAFVSHRPFDDPDEEEFAALHRR